MRLVRINRDIYAVLFFIEEGVRLVASDSISKIIFVLNTCRHISTSHTSFTSRLEYPFGLAAPECCQDLDTFRKGNRLR